MNPISLLKATMVAIPVVAMASAQAMAQEELPVLVVTAPSPFLPPWAQSATASGPADGNLRPIPANVFTAVTVIPAATLERSSASTLGDAISHVPGVTSSGFAPAAGRPIIRGLDNNRVRIQENGVAVMDVSAIGEDHGVPIDPLAAQRVEILRGPATLRWGSQAIGGVVDAQNNRIPLPGTPQGLSGVIRGGFTGVDNGREGAVIINGRHGSYAVHADMYKRTAEDYRTPDGKQRNSSLEMQGYAFGASYIFDSGYIGAAISHFGSLYHVPGSEAEDRKVRIDLAQTKFTSKGEIRVNSAFIDTIRFWFGAGSYRHHEIADEGAGPEIKSTFRNRQYEGRVEVQFLPVKTAMGDWKSALGLQFSRRNIGTAGEAGELLSPARETHLAAYLFNELHFAQEWRFQVAARIESVRIHGSAAEFPDNFLPNGLGLPEAAASRNFLPVSISAGIQRDLPLGLIASLAVQYVQRAPTALELYSKGPHEATGTFEIGSTTLQKERALSLEAGIRKATGRLRFNATAFHTRYAGYIFKRFTGASCGEDFDSCGVEDELRQVVFGQKNATFTGAELYGQYDIAPLFTGMFGVEGQFDVVRARFADGTNVPRIPPVRLGGGAYWYGNGWFARVKLLHAFAQKSINPAEETATGGYSLLSADLSYKHSFKAYGAQRHVTIGIKAANLLDARARNHVSFKKDEVLLPGRNVKAYLTVRF
jgi:iron complex outermembrane recepter protein